MPGLVARLVRVDARYAAGRVCERLGQALDRAKVHLKAHRDDERVVRELAARVRADRVVRRVEGRDVLGNVRDVLRNKAGERLAERRLLLQASTDESPVIRVLVLVQGFSPGEKGEKLIGLTIRAVRTEENRLYFG